MAAVLQILQGKGLDVVARLRDGFVAIVCGVRVLVLAAVSKLALSAQVVLTNDHLLRDTAASWCADRGSACQLTG